MASSDSRTIIGSAIVPFRLVFFIWLVFVLDFVYYVDLKHFGIIPRTFDGLWGIIFSPLLHGNLIHIVSNTAPLLFLGAVLFYFYKGIASTIFIRCYILTNILVWIFARSSNHIGASGLIYGLAFFLISFGLFRRDFLSIIISIIVISLYGYLIYGLIPTNSYISWESHLSGAIIGVISGYQLRNSKI